MAEEAKPIVKAENKSFSYKLSPRHDWRDVCITISANGERINLAGKDVTVPREASAEDPRTSVSVRAATHDEMAEHFNKGFQDLIIRVNK